MTELVALAPDVIFANTFPIVVALQQATRSVPIVFAGLIDPVGAGLVASLGRPGGNTTGFAGFEYGMSVKWLELLKQIAPRMTRVAVLRDSLTTVGIGQLAAIQGVAPSLGVELSPLVVRDAAEIERCRRRVRARLERRSDRHHRHVGTSSSRSDHHARSPASAARGLPLPHLRHERRPDLLRT